MTARRLGGAWPGAPAAKAAPAAVQTAIRTVHPPKRRVRRILIPGPRRPRYFCTVKNCTKNYQSSHTIFQSIVRFAVTKKLFVGLTTLFLLAGGQTNSLVYSLIANNNYTGNTIPVKIMLAEKYGKYAENRQINLSFNQTITSNKIIINEQKEQREDISIATLTSDVDRNIPRNPEVNDKTFAVIIANENYTLLPAVPYALNDGSIFSEYCHLTLGIPRKNIHFVKDATLNNMRAEIDWIQQIACAYEGKARVIVYYAGHGIPDEKTRTSYLLPVDSYGSNVLTGYNLSDLYAALSKYPTFSTIILLDACFSGAQRNGEMLVSARSVAIRSKVETPNGNLVVLSAATGDETAYPYQEKKHGMFTYFLLKKLQETNGDAHLGEIAEYVKEQVQKCSLVENLKGQTPTIISSRKIMTYWQDLKLK